MLAAAPSTRSQILLGIAFVVASGVLFTVGSAITKSLSSHVSASQFVMFRGVPGLIPILFYLRMQGGLPGLKTGRPGAHFFRVSIGVLATFAGLYAIRDMPLADYVAINFAGPVFATALAVPILGEAVGWRRWLAVFAGFIGVVLIAQPTGEGLGPGAWLGIASALGYGFVIIAMRNLGKTEKAVTTTFYFYIGLSLSGVAGLPFDWQPLSLADVLKLCVIGVLSAIAQIMLTQAYRLAPPAIISPFDYVSMVWALLLGLAIFGSFPTVPALVGTAIVIAAGAFILYRETVRGHEKERIKPGA